MSRGMLCWMTGRAVALCMNNGVFHISAMVSARFVCAPVVQFTWRHWTWSRHWCFCVCLHPFLLLLSYYGDPSLQGHWRSLQLCINTEIIINFCFHFDVWEVILLEKLTISMCMALNFYFYFRHAKFVEICAQTVELFASQEWWVAVW